MRIVKRIRNDAILLALVCVAGYVAYQVLLDDHAKQGVRDLTDTVVDSYNSLTKMVDDHIGTIMDEEAVVQNKLNIKQAWADLGY